jgi:hypothetical protein
MKRLLFLIISTTILLSAFSQPISLHPDNPHYFFFRGKPLAIISSGEHYGAVINPDFDYVKYLTTLQKEGMPYTRLFAGTYFEKSGSFGIEKNTLAPAYGKALLPWKRSNEPGAVAGGNKFDLDKWDESYFDRLKSFISEASDRGIIVEISLFSSIYDFWDIQVWNPRNNINIRENVSKQSVQTLNNGSVLKYQEMLVRKIVRELNVFDNTIFEIQNEPWSDHTVRTEPNDEFQNNSDFKLDGHEWQKKIEIADQSSLDWQKKIGSFIADEEAGLKKKHLIAQNFSNFYSVVSEVDKNVSVLNFHYAYPIAVEKNFHQKRVIGFDESGFAGTEDATYRMQAWKFIISGGGLFNNLDYSFAVGSEDGKAVNKAPGGGSTDLRKQFRFLSEFFHSFNFLEMKPDTITVDQTNGTFARVFSEPGKQYAIYMTKGSGSNLKLNLHEGAYLIEWYSTTEGRVTDFLTVSHKGGDLLLKVPAFTHDIALKIKKTKNEKT